MTRYLVTGAAGNLARLLVERLRAAGNEVTGLDREPSVVAGVRFEQADITDSATPGEARSTRSAPSASCTWRRC